MPKVTYEIIITKNDGLVITPIELLEKYFHGSLPKKADGTYMPLEVIESYIRDAQNSVESELSLVLQYQLVSENTIFETRAYSSWCFTKTTYPVDIPISFTGFLNKLKQINYPADWITQKKETSTRGEQSRHRRVNLVPAGNTGAQTSGTVIFAGMTPHLGLMNLGNIADYWTISYLSGFEKIPQNITSVISKKASIPIFMILGDLIMGAGIASKSLSIDGLSQSVSSTAGQTSAAYGARINEMRKEIEKDIAILKDCYCSLTISVL